VESLAHCPVLLLEHPDAIRRVGVERHLQVTVVKLLEKSDVIWKELLVPTGMSATSALQSELTCSPSMVRHTQVGCR
jgi:hypothetical protein